jgi:WD40 repeat protein
MVLIPVHAEAAMRYFMTTLVIALLTPLSASATGAADVAKPALDVLRANCYRCHGQDGRHEGKLNDVLDLSGLRERQFIVPGDAGKSRLLTRITKGQMPPPEETPRPTPADVERLRAWIDAGAQAPSGTDLPVVPPNDVEIDRLVLADLERFDRRARRFQRYFSLVPLARAGASEALLRTYRAGLNKLLNSLSWHSRIATLQVADQAGLLLRVDLRDLLWDAGLWNRVVAEYPYGILAETGAFRAVAAASLTRLPVVRADWFLATASRPPLYHDLLQLPTTAGELERQLRLDAAVDIQQERVARAGFTGSGVSRNNRLIERHPAPHGAYWRTYDFDAVQQPTAERQNLRPDRRNLFAFPLGPGTTDGTFQHAGGEIIWHLPNGLLGFMLVDANNRRIDKAPTAIVSDPRRPDRAVEPGVSCMSCHSTGIQPKTDQIRAHVARNAAAFPKNDAELVRALYPPETALTKFMEEDAERFRRAIEQCGCKVTEADPVSAAAQRYEADLDARSAAAELGLAVDEFRRRLAETTLAQGLGALRTDGGTVHRAVFQQTFGDLVRALRRGALVQPSVVAGALADNTGELDPLEGPSSITNAAAVLPDRRAVLLASADRSLRLVEIASGRELRRFVGHATSVWSVAVSPDGRRALSGGLDGSVRVWDIATGQELRRLDGHDGLVSAAAFLPDGAHAVTAGFDHAVIVWDLESGREIGRTDRLASAVYSLAIDASGRQALAGGDPAVWLIDLDAAKVVERFVGHTRAVTALAFAPDGRHFLSASDDGTARLWDVESARVVRSVAGHSGGATAVAFEDPATILTGDSAGIIRRWKSAAEGEPDVLARQPAPIIALHPTPDGHGVGVGRDGSVRPLDTPVRRTSIRESEESPETRAVEVSPEILRPRAVVSLGGTLASPLLSSDGRALFVLNRTEHRVLRLDTATLRTTAAFAAAEAVETIALSRDGESVYVASARDRRGALDILDAATLRSRRSIALESTPYDIAAGPNGLAFVSDGGSGWTEIRLVDTARGQEIASWGGVWARSLVAATADGTRLLTCTQGVTPGRVESLVVPTPLSEKPAVRTAPAEVAVGGPIMVSPDGQYLLCGTGAVLGLSTVPADDLRPAARMEPFLAACVALDRKSVLTLSDDGALHVSDYPTFRGRTTVRLPAAAFAMALDGASGRLYVTGVAPQTLRDRPRAVVYGDVMVFDVHALLP